MTLQRNGLLLVLMDAPAGLEEEFHAWYDQEHVPERKTLPGFLTAERYVALSGYPRFMAIYDLDTVEALHTQEYLAVAGANFSPWTKRVTSRVQAARLVAEQVYPGQAPTPPASRLLLFRLRDLKSRAEEEVVAAVRATCEAWPETLALRVFASREQERRDYLALVSLSPPPVAIDLSELGPFSRAVDIVNVYARRDLMA